MPTTRIPDAGINSGRRFEYGSAAKHLEWTLSHDRTPAGVVRRWRVGEDFFGAVRTTQDAFRAADTYGRRVILSEEPALTGDPRYDAYLAAHAEWMALRSGDIDPPLWVGEAHRFLHKVWIPVKNTTYRATLLAHAPISFSHRGIWIDENSLVRL
jgi:hypothetical protein